MGVLWSVATDASFATIVAGGVATAEADGDHAVHVLVEGLDADRWYWYRFKAAGQISPTGRTRTLPPAGAVPDRLRFALASCQHYESGLFTAYEHLAREDLDLVFHLGNYIYEHAAPENRVRRHNNGEPFTLSDYRVRYALYQLDPALQAAHAIAPWIVTWGDHEVANSDAGKVTGTPPPREDFLTRRAAAYQRARC